MSPWLRCSRVSSATTARRSRSHGDLEKRRQLGQHDGVRPQLRHAAAPPAEGSTLGSFVTGFDATGRIICSGTTPACAAESFTFTVFGVESATLLNWPGTSRGFGTAACGVTVLSPSGNISNLAGDTWAVTSMTGFATCNLVPQTPIRQSVGAVSGIQGNGRPYCSNSSVVFASGPSQASVVINCN